METTAATTQPALTATAGTVKAFLLAHPVGVAIVGGALVGEIGRASCRERV